MTCLLLAAAGIAEAAWAFATLLMWVGLIIICTLGLTSMLMRSPIFAGIALASLVLFSLFFQPWCCFSPFEAKYYDDPDVVEAANHFYSVGVGWGMTVLFVLASVVFAWRKPAGNPLK